MRSVRSASASLARAATRSWARRDLDRRARTQSVLGAWCRSRDRPRSASTRAGSPRRDRDAAPTGVTPFDRMTALVVPAFDAPGMPVLFGVAGRGMTDRNVARLAE